jgi:hypothetical protein
MKNGWAKPCWRFESIVEVGMKKKLVLVSIHRRIDKFLYELSTGDEWFFDKDRNRLSLNLDDADGIFYAIKALKAGEVYQEVELKEHAEYRGLAIVMNEYEKNDFQISTVTDFADRTKSFKTEQGFFDYIIPIDGGVTVSQALEVHKQYLEK